MRYFLDTEFNEDGRTIDLISIAIVREDGKEYYAISTEFDIGKAYKNQWLVDNVLINLPVRNINLHDPLESPRLKEQSLLWKPKNIIRNDIINFFLNDDKKRFYGYYCSYDWVGFCQIFGKMADLPDGYPMYCNDIKQIVDQLGISRGMPAQLETEGNHHALLGARWNKLAYEYLVSIDSEVYEI